MDYQFTSEQRLWHETIHTFMEKEVGREYTREHDASREFPWAVYKKMGELGWLGLLLAEAPDGHPNSATFGHLKLPHLN